MSEFTAENRIAARIVIGVLAHVDAGKTTLSEAMLYRAGTVRKPGRVDTGDTVMDTHELEKKRGITIFSAEAPFSVKDRDFVLLDTPGHVDFSAEMERTLNVLDACILVVSGTEGVQPHTRTLWRLLSLYGIPTFVFVSKMDYARLSEEELMRNLAEELGDSFVNFSGDPEARDDAAAMCDEDLLQFFLERGALTDRELAQAVSVRRVFPVFFGSGLKGTGVEKLMEGLERFLEIPEYPADFGARIYKVGYDSQDSRLVHMKITGGSLKVKDTIRYTYIDEKGERQEIEEKINQIRIYTGEKYAAVDSADAGELCTVSGLSAAANGAGLGYEKQDAVSVLEPVMLYSLGLPEGTDPLLVMPKLKKLEEEDPLLKIRWNPYTLEIEVGLMGEVQAEILKSLILERFSLDVTLGKGHVVYRESISKPVEGVGHYEPLRHYAEVHVLIEPLPRGSGIQYDCTVSTDQLDRNWQRLILTHLKEKEHLGVLTGSPLTDVKLTVVNGKASIRHTEGGDFRQATYRAVRQGLMSTESVLLEPYYRFRLEAPQEALSRAAADIREMGGSFLPPVYAGAHSVLTGRAPVMAMNDYAKTVSAYTGGTGSLVLETDGYDLCHNAEEVIREKNYLAEGDLANTPDSVFCAHGAGFPVRWSSVPNYMHLPYLEDQKKEAAPARAIPRRIRISEDDLEEIMMREFGPIRRPEYGKPRKTVSALKKPEKKAAADGDDLSRVRPDLLVIDGYNVIFAWEELRALAEQDIASARGRLAHIVSNYAGFIRCEAVLVFDGYRVPGNPGEAYDLHNIQVVYTKEKETADLYIEQLLSTLKKGERARVVTSDNIIQLNALKSGVLRMSSQEFLGEVMDADERISEIIEKNRMKSSPKIGDSVEMPQAPL